MRFAKSSYVFLICLVLLAGCSKNQNEKADSNAGQPNVVTDMNIQTEPDASNENDEQ